MFKKLKLLWQTIRRLSGDDAYEQYLLHFVHHQKEHPHAEPLSQEEFFKQWQDKKWKGVKRCC
jgi:uncharacterized short protein YbdD (DUF466 family)